jgi:hypothetical protein
MALRPALEEYWVEHESVWRATAQALKPGVRIPDPHDFSDTYLGLESFLGKVGIKYFGPREAVKMGYPWPPQCCWVGLAVLLLIADHMRGLTGLPIRLRHWYRSEKFNRERKGAPYSDHLWAVAVDLDFTGKWWTAVFARRKAQRWLTRKAPILLRNISLGVGWRTLHVGLFAPRTLEKGRHRRWKYGKLPKTEKFLAAA